MFMSTEHIGGCHDCIFLANMFSSFPDTLPAPSLSFFTLVIDMAVLESYDVVLGLFLLLVKNESQK